MPTCYSCKHIYSVGEAHECPSAEYVAARNALVYQAASANVTEENEAGVIRKYEKIRNAPISVNNYPAGIYQSGEVFIDTAVNRKQLNANDGMVYLTVLELRALLKLAESLSDPLLSIDMALPALRGIASGLRAAPGAVGLTLSIFMAGFAATPILYGPVSDRYGRRPVLLAGVAMFALGGLAAAAAPSIDALLLARFIEGGGAGCGIAMAFAIVRDVFAGEEARIKLSYVQMVMALAPMVAPTIGAALLLAGGWRVIYAVLGCGGVALLLVILLGFRETHEPRAGGSLFGAVVAGYRTLLQSRAGLGFALVYACSFGVQFSYIAGSPLVFMGYFGL